MKKLLLAALLAAILIGVLAAFTKLDWARVSDTLLALDPALVLASFGAYALSFVLRGVRLGILVPGASTLPHLFSMSARHILMAIVLPFRSGEASLPLMLSMECGRPGTEGVSVLGIMRVLDLLCVAACLVAGVLLGGASGASDTAAMSAEDLRTRGLITLAALAAGLLLLRPIAKGAAPLARSPKKVLALAGGIAEKVASLGTRQLTSALLVSLATWVCTYGACWLLLRAMTPPGALGEAARVSFAAALVGTTGLHLSAAFPASPLAGVGTWEAGWMVGYRFVGMSEQDALTSAIVSHVAVLSFIVLLGGASFALRRRAP